MIQRRATSTAVAVVLLVLPSVVYGQSISVSLLDQERQIGPLGLSLHSPFIKTEQVPVPLSIPGYSSTFDQAKLRLVWRYRQPPVYGPILGGIIGSNVGHYLAFLTERPRSGIGYGLGPLVAYLLLRPLGEAIGVHGGNAELGSFGWDFLVSFIINVPGMVVGYNLYGPDQLGAAAVASLVTVPVTVLVERLAAAKKLRKIEP